MHDNRIASISELMRRQDHIDPAFRAALIAHQKQIPLRAGDFARLTRRDADEDNMMGRTGPETMPAQRMPE